MSRRSIYISFFAFLFGPISSAQINNYEVKILKEFENFISTHISSYQSDNRASTINKGDDWYHSYYECLPQYDYDLQTTNSLVMPFGGFLEFSLIKWRSNLAKSKDEAENNGSISIYETRIHKHMYGYKNNHWVILSRKSKRSTDNEYKWYNCDIKKDGCMEYFD